MHTLRARLTVGLVVLLAVSCAAVGVAAVVELNGFLTGRLDQQLRDAGVRFPASLEHGGSLPSDLPRSRKDSPGGTLMGVEDGDEDGDTRRQAVGTFGCRLVGDTVTDAAVVGSSSGTGAVPVPLGAADRRKLAAVPADGDGHTIDLSSMDDYRVMAAEGRDGDVLITGLPMEPVEATVHRLELVAGIVFGAALAVAGVAGALWVRWSLRPLSSVAATATRVSELPLASGEVALPPRAPESDPRSEVGRVASAFDMMLGHVGEALTKRHTSEERLRSFAADASHELRTPVASIRGHAELALLHPDPVPQKVVRALERIEAEAARMGEMVDDLLLLARLDAGRPLERRPVDLTRLVLDAVTDAQAAGPGHRWTLELPEEPVTVPGDAHRLHQVLANLLANARLHTPVGSTVTISLRTDAGTAVLTVHDDGPGVAEDIRPKVFERFTRADRRRTEGAGTGAGLGLSIVAAVAEAHDGSVTLDSGPGSTTFTVRLPTGEE
ncbi:sensor histidine kinase [Streptomyces sp. NBC_00391]|uniref:sensor histidine kinase n=1 Tax=Streptomyces sp. NBC_00391 TaxID=2903647 RepID=UPI002E1E1290